MKCSEIEPLLYLVREGERSRKEQAEVEKHLATCAGCREIYRSVVRMTDLIGRFPFHHETGNNRTKVTEKVMGHIERGSIHWMGNNRFSPGFFLIKAAAATMLVFLISVFVVQETRFQKNRYEFRLRMQEMAAQERAGEYHQDCVETLARKIKSRKNAAFVPADIAFTNTVSEEQLARYVYQVCGSSETDMTTIRKLLQQAGLIISNPQN